VDAAGGGHSGGGCSGDGGGGTDVGEEVDLVLKADIVMWSQAVERIKV